MNPGISVIIPSYNRANTIGRALDSVFSQTQAILEIIVIDDGSSDHGKDLIKTQYPRVRLLAQAHQGVSAARNLGIRKARGEWLAFLDSDDLWLPNKLELQCQALASNRNYRVIHTNEKWMRNGLALRQLKKHRKYGGHIFQHCLPLCVISPSSIMIHRDVFTAVGLFDEDLPVCEDYDMWLRICCRYPVLFLDRELIVKYGGHADQLSVQYRGMDRFRVQALAKILAGGIADEADRKAAVEMLLKKISIYLRGAKKHGNNQSVREFERLREHYSGRLKTDSGELSV